MNALEVSLDGGKTWATTEVVNFRVSSPDSIQFVGTLTEEIIQVSDDPYDEGTVWYLSSL